MCLPVIFTVNLSLCLPDLLQYRLYSCLCVCLSFHSIFVSVSVGLSFYRAADYVFACVFVSLCLPLFLQYNFLCVCLSFYCTATSIYVSAFLIISVYFFSLSYMVQLSMCLSYMLQLSMCLSYMVQLSLCLSYKVQLSMCFCLVWYSCLCVCLIW